MGDRALGVVNGRKAIIGDLAVDSINDLTISRGANNDTFSLFLGGDHGANAAGVSIVALGYRSLQVCNTTFESVALGAFAGAADESGYHNVYIGQEAGSFNVSGFRNTLVGSYAMIFGGGEENTCIGFNAGAGLFGGNRNVLIGSYAGFNYEGNDSLIIGNSMTSYLISGNFDTGRVGINVDPANISLSAALQVDSTTGGFLGPRMTTLQRDALPEVEGTEIYNLDDNEKQYFNGTQWVSLGSSSSGSTVYSGTVEVDFGASGTYKVVTVAAAWASPTRIMTLSITPNLTDHSIEDVLLEELKCTYGNIVNGVSFDIHLYAPNSTWGRYNVNIIGV